MSGTDIPTKRKHNLDEFVEQNFTIRCKVKHTVVDVLVYKRPVSSIISSSVECKYNSGAHGEDCNLTRTRLCPYVFDLR